MNRCIAGMALVLTLAACQPEPLGKYSTDNPDFPVELMAITPNGCRVYKLAPQSTSALRQQHFMSCKHLTPKEREALPSMVDKRVVEVAQLLSYDGCDVYQIENDDVVTHCRNQADKTWVSSNDQ